MDIEIDDLMLQRLERILVTTGQKWKQVDGTSEYPTKESVKKVLDNLVSTLYDGEGQQAESGGLLVQNWYGHYDVYIRIGEINDPDNSEE